MFGTNIKGGVFSSTILICSLFLILSACGGGGGDGNNNDETGSFFDSCTTVQVPSLPIPPMTCDGPDDAGWTNAPRPDGAGFCPPPSSDGCTKVVIGRQRDTKKYISCPGYIVLHHTEWTPQLNDQFIACIASEQLGTCDPTAIVVSERIDVPDYAGEGSVVTSTELCQLHNSECDVTFADSSGPGHIADCIYDQSFVCTDEDGDGYYAEAACSGATDCFDADAEIHPEAVEICDDGIDNDCDDEIDCDDGDCNNDDACPIGCPQIDGVCTTSEQSEGLTLTYWLTSPGPYGGGAFPYCKDSSGNLLTPAAGGLTTAEIITTGDWDENRNGWWDSEVLTCGDDVPARGLLVCAEGVECDQECETIEGTCTAAEQSSGLKLKYLLKAQPPWTGPAIPYCENSTGTLFTPTPYGLRNAEVTQKGDWVESWNGWWDSQLLTCGSDVPAGGVLVIVE